MTSHHFNNIETTPVVGVIGTSATSRGIARIVAQAGLALRLHDANPQTPAAARDYLADHFAKLAAKVAVRRYRPSPWLARHARLGLSLAQPDTTDINEPNEARA